MRGVELSPSSVASAVGSDSIPSPQSEAVTSEMQELSLQPIPSLLPLKERKNGKFTQAHDQFIKIGMRMFSFMQIENQIN